MQLTTTQSKHIQILRGLAIIAVVFIHNTPIGLPQVYIRPFLNFSVGLFLFLSGLLSKNSSWNPQKRLKKLLVPYLIWSFAYVCSQNFHTLANVPLGYLKAVLFGNAESMMYYVFVYCEFTLLIPLLEKLANSKYKYLGFVISPLEIICMRMIPMIAGYQHHRFMEILLEISCLGWFSYFYLGYLLGNRKIVIRYRNFFLYVALGISIVLQFLEANWYRSLGITNCGTQLKLSTLLTGAIIALIAYNFINASKEYSVRSLALLGDHSFGIFFSHMAVMRVLGAIPFYEAYAVYPINALVALVVSFALCCIGKKVLGKFGWYLAL